MIVGIGIDVIEVERVREAVSRLPRFEEKIFTPEEIRYCRSKKDGALNLAARFAAKEAFFKALGRRVAWTQVQVVNLPSGQPELVLRTEECLPFDKAHVSLSHIKGFAQAVVVLEKLP